MARYRAKRGLDTNFDNNPELVNMLSERLDLLEEKSALDPDLCEDPDDRNWSGDKLPDWWDFVCPPSNYAQVKLFPTTETPSRYQRLELTRTCGPWPCRVISPDYTGPGDNPLLGMESPPQIFAKL